ncbi:hypothetical protein ACHHYP_00321 [Achlya hypogyna]|uniref:Uncharacterized protein n=1 Tax=Achlya hypogyna TaxID=1202772 RepID=A0A1V9ZUM0_ACHHY|nr:hypothetical protein ACHHYP_00321 [Achlya hypogyna]
MSSCRALHPEDIHEDDLHVDHEDEEMAMLLHDGDDWNVDLDGLELDARSPTAVSDVNVSGDHDNGYEELLSRVNLSGEEHFTCLRMEADERMERTSIETCGSESGSDKVEDDTTDCEVCWGENEADEKAFFDIDHRVICDKQNRFLVSWAPAVVCPAVEEAKDTTCDDDQSTNAAAVSPLPPQVTETGRMVNHILASCLKKRKLHVPYKHQVKLVNFTPVVAKTTPTLLTKVSPTLPMIKVTSPLVTMPTPSLTKSMPPKVDSPLRTTAKTSSPLLATVGSSPQQSKPATQLVAKVGSPQLPSKTAVAHIPSSTPPPTKASPPLFNKVSSAVVTAKALTTPSSAIATAKAPSATGPPTFLSNISLPARTALPLVANIKAPEQPQAPVAKADMPGFVAPSNQTPTMSKARDKDNVMQPTDDGKKIELTTLPKKMPSPGVPCTLLTKKVAQEKRKHAMMSMASPPGLSLSTCKVAGDDHISEADMVVDEELLELGNSITASTSRILRPKTESVLPEMGSAMPQELRDLKLKIESTESRVEGTKHRHRKGGPCPRCQVQNQLRAAKRALLCRMKRYKN